MGKFEPTTELILMLIDVKQYSAAASVEMGFVDTFEGYAELIASEILKSARSGDTRGLERTIEKTTSEIDFHRRWETDVNDVLAKIDHQTRDADCLKRALAHTKSVRRSLGHQVESVMSTLNSFAS